MSGYKTDDINNEQKISTFTSLSISDNAKETLDPCVILMKQIISKHSHLWVDKGGIKSLAQGVVYWKPPSTAYDAISRAAAAAATTDSDDIYDNVHKYCPDEGLPSLREALVKKLSIENGLNKKRVDLIVTSGANQAYVNCILTLLSPGEKCIVFQPFYFNHVMAIQMANGKDSVVIGPTDDDGNGIPDLNWLRTTLRENKDGKIKIVTLVNPGNPTGVSLPASTLDQIVEMTREAGVWLVMDCTYEHFDHTKVNVARGGVREDIIPFRCYDDEHVINIFSFSKGYGMAGLRVGYIVLNTGDDGDGTERAKECYKQMLKIQDTIPICASNLSQVMALGALSIGRQWVYDRVETLMSSRDAILKAMKPLDRIMGGSGAMYVMGKLPQHQQDDEEVANFLIEKYGIAVIPGSYCGYPGWIRVCYSNLPPDECLVAAKRLSDGINDL